MAQVPGKRYLILFGSFVYILLNDTIAWVWRKKSYTVVYVLISDNEVDGAELFVSYKNHVN